MSDKKIQDALQKGPGSFAHHDVREADAHAALERAFASLDGRLDDVASELEEVVSTGEEIVTKKQQFEKLQARNNAGEGGSGTGRVFTAGRNGYDADAWNTIVDDYIDPIIQMSTEALELRAQAQAQHTAGMGPGSSSSSSSSDGHRGRDDD